MAFYDQCPPGGKCRIACITYVCSNVRSTGCQQEQLGIKPQREKQSRPLPQDVTLVGEDTQQHLDSGIKIRLSLLLAVTVSQSSLVFDDLTRTKCLYKMSFVFSFTDSTHFQRYLGQHLFAPPPHVRLCHKLVIDSFVTVCISSWDSLTSQIRFKICIQTGYTLCARKFNGF